jgi:hypothetical protein
MMGCAPSVWVATRNSPSLTLNLLLSLVYGTRQAYPGSISNPTYLPLLTTPQPPSSGPAHLFEILKPSTPLLLVN